MEVGQFSHQGADVPGQYFDILSVVAHDIRTPMNNIMGMATLANKYMDDRDRLTTYLNKIMLSSQNLLQLLNEVLEMSRIESGNMYLAEEEIDIYDFTDNIYELLIPQLQARSQSLDIKYDNVCHPIIISDSLKLQQCFLNFLTNSIKYSPNNSKITLTIAETDYKASGSASYRFIFEDNGYGIGMDFIEHIFEPFARENIPEIRSIPGTGLGMPIVYNIINLLGGDISVWSRKNVGTRFTVDLKFKINDKAAEQK